MTGRPQVPAVLRFFRFVEYDPITECWLWTGHTINGYGQFAGERGDGGNGSELAHRFAFKLLVGPIGEGLTLDHLCHGWNAHCPGGSDCAHRRCVNPAHLEPVTIGENVMRSPLAPASRNRAKTHCTNGHPLTGENLAPNKNGTRICLQCRQERGRRYVARNADRLRVESRERWRRKNWLGYESETAA